MPTRACQLSRSTWSWLVRLTSMLCLMLKCTMIKAAVRVIPTMPHLWIPYWKPSLSLASHIKRWEFLTFHEIFYQKLVSELTGKLASSSANVCFCWLLYAESWHVSVILIIRTDLSVWQSSQSRWPHFILISLVMHISIGECCSNENNIVRPV